MTNPMHSSKSWNQESSELAAAVGVAAVVVVPTCGPLSPFLELDGLSSAQQLANDRFLEVAGDDGLWQNQTLDLVE